MNSSNQPGVIRLLPLLLPLWFAGCATAPDATVETDGVTDSEDVAEEEGAASYQAGVPGGEEDGGEAAWQGTQPEEMISDNPAAQEPVKVFPGTGRFVRSVDVPKAGTIKPGDITLNFENTDLREVVKVILGDLLAQNYILDPGVRGGVTMQTSRPLTKEALLPTLETLLRMNNSGLVKIDGVFHVLPLAKITKGTTVPQLADAVTALPTGHSIQLIPLQYISADEMTKILQPLVNDGSIIRTDAKRNLLLISGTGRELQYILDTIRTFDVDWIAGMSVGFFELKYAKSEDVQRDLDTILNAKADADLGNLLRIMPIESINGLLVVTPRPHYLEEVSSWIDRLDKIGAGEDAEPQLFVYRVRNGDAEKLSGLLGDLFAEDKNKKSNSKSAEVAPGLTPKTVGTDTYNEGDQNKAASSPKTTSVSAEDATSANLEAELRIVADPDNNALLIMATPRDYQKVLRVLERLDVVPLQVHVEATIVEIVLSDDLQYGLQWYFDSRHGSSYTSDTSWGTASQLGRTFPGFNWALINSAAEVRMVLTALAGDSKVQVLSAPSVMVLDNHTANIKVGDQVPISTRQITDGDTIVSTQYRDTGIMLSVKPRVNPGGLVTMEIEQEVSSPSPTSSGDTNSWTIASRNISSTVAVQSGQAVVLGGLIRDEATKRESGVPGLYTLPVVGSLFGETQNNSQRTELVVILTPRVISNDRDARRITEDFRSRLQGLEGRF